MSGNRRQSRPSATTPVDSIPNTRTMGNERLRVFIRNMETPNSFREAFGEHLGIPSVRTRLHPPQPGVLLQRVGNVAQRRRDMVPVGTSSWQDGLPHRAWRVLPHDSASLVIVARLDLGSSTTHSGVIPSCLYRFWHRADTCDHEDQDTYLDVMTHETFFSAFFSRIPFSIVTSAVILPGDSHHEARLPVIHIGVSISDLGAMYHIVQWIYLQDSSQFLQGLFGDGISAKAERVIKYDYRTRSRALSPYRLHATLVETTLRIVRALPRTTSADDILLRRLLRIDAVFRLADDLGLEDDTFWKTISAARRLVFDICAIRHQQDLRSEPLGPGNVLGNRPTS